MDRTGQARQDAQRRGGGVPRPWRRRRDRPRHWSQHPLLVVALALTLVFGGGLGAAAFLAGTTLSTLHTLSTPPPHIAGDLLGGSGAVEVETGPAQAALRAEHVQGRAPAGGGPWGAARTVARGAQELTGAAAVAAGVSGPPAAPAGTNLLLMGVDAPAGQPIDSGVPAEGLLLLHLDPRTGSCRILTIPGTVRAELPGYGPTMISNALAVGGIPYQRQVIARFLDLSIPHYGLINLAGLPDLVQALGGVTIDNDEAFTVGEMTFPRGPQRLDGPQALAFSRFAGGPDGEAGRLRRRQMLIRAVVTQAARPQVVSDLPKLLPALERHLRTDLTLPEMVALVRGAGPTCSGSAVEAATLRGTSGRFFDPLLHTERSYLVVAPRERRDTAAWLTGGEAPVPPERG